MNSSRHPRSKQLPSSTEEAGEPVLSIGALSHATGVPVETLRTWERRYGFPAPGAREESGHRRYPLSTVERLRLVLRALEAGHRPSVALRASAATLRDLLAIHPETDDSLVQVRRVGGSFIERCLEHVTYLDGPGLIEELELAWNGAGALEFLIGSVGPLLRAIGESWGRGDIEVGHEHFASEHIREFLASRWRPMSERARGPRIVCATVGGERHVLGLHMAATALALGGAQIVFLGADMPPKEVASAATRQRAEAIALSAALGTGRRALYRDVRRIRDSVREDVPIVVGGAGFDPPPPGTLALFDLEGLSAWASRLPRAT